MSFFVNLLFGHLIGDYFVQNDWMALNKSKNSFHCAIHVTLYTLSIVFFTSFNPLWLAFVWLSHFVVDRFSLADKWLQLTNGCSPTKYIETAYLSTNKEQRNFIALRAGFTAFVYIVVDNTIHLMSMYYLYPYLTN
jgi:hypothetical protein